MTDIYADVKRWASEHYILTAVIIVVVLCVIAGAICGIVAAVWWIKQPAAPPPAPDDLMQPLPTTVTAKANVAAAVAPTSTQAVTAAQSAYLSEAAAVQQSNVIIRAAPSLPGQAAAAAPSGTSQTASHAQDAAQTSDTASQTVISMFSGKFNAFSFLTIYQNGVLVYSATATSWKQIQFVNFMVTSGDVLVFVVQNTGNYGGLIGEFTFNGVTYHTNTTLFSSAQYIKEKANVAGNKTSGTPPEIAEWANAQQSSVAALPGTDWAGSVKPATYPQSSWVWEAGKCHECYVRFVWTAPGNLSKAAQKALDLQTADPLYNVYPGGLTLSAYFVANSFLYVFVNNEIMYGDPSLTSRKLQTFNMTVYPGDKIDFVVQNTGERNALNGNFTIGPTSYYTGTASSPFVNCAVIEAAGLSDLAGTIPQYPFSATTRCLCVVGDALDILPGSRAISPAVPVMGYAVYSMTLGAGPSGFVGAVNAVAPDILTKVTQAKNRFAQYLAQKPARKAKK